MKPLTLQEMIEALQNVTFQGAATDSPEGSRYVNMSETLINQFVGSLQALNESTDKAQESLKALGVKLEAATLERDVDVALAKAALELGSSDAEEAFKAQIIEACKDSEDQSQVIKSMIDAKEAELGLKDDNVPGLKSSSTDKLKTIDLKAHSLN